MLSYSSHEVGCLSSRVALEQLQTVHGSDFVNIYFYGFWILYDVRSTKLCVRRCDLNDEKV